MTKIVLAFTLIFALLFATLSGAKAAQFDYEQFEGLPYYEPPVITISSPAQNRIYTISDVPLNITVQIAGFVYHNMERVVWLNYSLDKKAAIQMTLIVPSSEITQLPYPVYANDMLTGLPDGAHNLTIHGRTAIGGLVGTFNETISFSVDTSNKPNGALFLTPLIAAVFVGVFTLATVGLLVYHKRKHRN